MECAAAQLCSAGELDSKPATRPCLKNSGGSLEKEEGAMTDARELNQACLLPSILPIHPSI